MSESLPRPELGLTAAEAQAQFDDLQKKLAPLWRSIQSINQDEQTIVVTPSLTVDAPIGGSLLKAYEERFLFLLLLLRQPRARLIYVTSQTIQPEVVDYYLHMLPGVIASHARKRLFLVAPDDASPRPLSLKLLERPNILRRIRSLIPDPNRAHLVPFNTTILERDLALRLGIPMYGADPKFFPLGTKSGSRRLFTEAGIRHPLGMQGLRSLDEIVDAVMEMRRERPAMRQVIVKLDEGVGGMGNSLVHLEGIPASGEAGERDAILAQVQAMEFEIPEVNYTYFMERFEAHGGVVEERIMGEVFRSPSAQLRITPLGVVEMLSTHDQLLGGPSGQSYFGARFPADRAYAAAIMRDAAKVGKLLAEAGVLGRFAIDFVAVLTAEGEWETYAIEINLRKGGTTHPFLTLQFLTDGVYDAEAGVFTTPLGQDKYFVASDHLENPLYRIFTTDDLFDIIARHGLQFNQSTQTGVVFHMMSALGEHGRIGFTAVANSPAEAQTLYERVASVLDMEAQAALA
ncbi:MAG: hypothetical protein J5I90_04735 [Caldilineales bacterium]|nr:hypothetical protein [Caldilineales bacterium]